MHASTRQYILLDLKSHSPGAGPGSADKDAASVRANTCTPSNKAIFYFEVEVISSGREGYIGAHTHLVSPPMHEVCNRCRWWAHRSIMLLDSVEETLTACIHTTGVGFCTADVNMDRLPGWEPQSYGYHGDDGNAFRSDGKGRRYGPTFGTGGHAL